MFGMCLEHYAICFTCIISFNPYEDLMSFVIFPILQMRKLNEAQRPRVIFQGSHKYFKGV